MRSVHSLAHTRTVNLGNARRMDPESNTKTWCSNTFPAIKLCKVWFFIPATAECRLSRAISMSTESVNAADWVIFRTNQQTDLSSKSLAEAYRLGDLTGDKLNDHADFVLFKSAYDVANGAGAFVTMIGSVPEPSTVVLVLTAGLISIPIRRRSGSRLIPGFPE